MKKLLIAIAIVLSVGGTAAPTPAHAGTSCDTWVNEVKKTYKKDWDRTFQLNMRGCALSGGKWRPAAYDCGQKAYDLARKGYRDQKLSSAMSKKHCTVLPTGKWYRW